MSDAESKDRDLQVKRGHILFLDMLGTTSMTADSLRTLNDALLPWLKAATSILEARADDTFVAWVSDSWLLLDHAPRQLLNLVDRVMCDLFRQRIYLRGWLMKSEFADLSNLPFLDRFNKMPNVTLAPLIGPGVTLPASMEKHFKGMRILCNCVPSLPDQSHLMSLEDAEQQSLKDKMKDICRNHQWPQKVLAAEYAWWHEDPQGTLAVIAEALKCADKPLQVHLLALERSIKRWIAGDAEWPPL